MADITGFRGDSLTYDFTVTQGGSAVDLTSSCLIFSVKERALDTSYALQRTNAVSGGIEITDATAGEATVCIDSTGVANASCSLKTGPHTWDMQMITTGSQPKTYTVLNGTFCVQEDITI
jgi:hypothetical protein